jgi:3-deoxy-manno-octulosonate cytidylyltransferase (CMP-KDO synthetase)
MRILGIIPARYASTRFPAKALADVAGKPMIQRVYEQAKKASSLHRLVVATDHPLILETVKQFGGNVCMTDEGHASGTDRCYEAYALQKEKFDYVINIQGDEPFIQPEQFDLLAGVLQDHVEIATLAKRITDGAAVSNPNTVKVVFSQQGFALYFSRSAIPHIRGVEPEHWVNRHAFYKHIGMYAYRADILEKLTQLPVSDLEKAESLEQLRWLENGFMIKVKETRHETIGIDTPEDLMRAMASHNFQ